MLSEHGRLALQIRLRQFAVVPWWFFFGVRRAARRVLGLEAQHHGRPVPFGARPVRGG